MHRGSILIGSDLFRRTGLCLFVCPLLFFSFFYRASLFRMREFRRMRRDSRTVQIGRTANISNREKGVVHTRLPLFSNTIPFILNLTTTPDVTVAISHYLFPQKKLSIRKRSRLSPNLIIAISIVVSEKVVKDDVERNKVLKRKRLDWDFHGSQLL
jgi:hypothetical protein